MVSFSLKREFWKQEQRQKKVIQLKREIFSCFLLFAFYIDHWLIALKTSVVDLRGQLKREGGEVRVTDGSILHMTVLLLCRIFAFRLLLNLIMIKAMKLVSYDNRQWFQQRLISELTEDERSSNSSLLE